MFGYINPAQLRNRPYRRLGDRPVPPGQVSQQGLTLIECLVAIIVIATVASAITPALVISVATRVQSQKAEQALDVAQGQIDGVRLLVEQGGYAATDLPPTAPAAIADDEPASMPGPVYATALPSCDAGFTAAAVISCSVDVNDDGTPDFAVQTYRTQGLSVSGIPMAFGMGVRVYDYTAVTSGASGNLPAERSATLGVTGGEGERKEYPLASLYTNVARSEDAESFCNMIGYLDSTASTPVGCTSP